MKLKLNYINSKRAFAYCPWHKSTKGTADLEICLHGTWQGKYYCHGCGKSGYVQMGVLNRLLKLRKKGGHKEPTAMDFESLVEGYRNNLLDNKVPIPFNVGEDIGSLMQIGWDNEAYTIPFSNTDRSTTGIQRRFPDGFKCMVEGSQLGLIIPCWLPNKDKPLYITEGASDLSVVLECGLQGIGRPNCSAIPEMIVEFCQIFTDIRIVCDNDEPGIKGAITLEELLIFRNRQTLIPEPYNDLYEMYEVKGKEQTRRFLDGQTQM